MRSSYRCIVICAGSREPLLMASACAPLTLQVADEAPSPLVTPDERSPDVYAPINVNAEHTSPAAVSKPDKSRVPKSDFWLGSH
jgi:hypothetical protein